jgi:hypothetical protein
MGWFSTLAPPAIVRCTWSTSWSPGAANIFIYKYLSRFSTTQCLHPSYSFYKLPHSCTQNPYYTFTPISEGAIPDDASVNISSLPLTIHPDHYLPWGIWVYRYIDSMFNQWSSPLLTPLSPVTRFTTKHKLILHSIPSPLVESPIIDTSSAPRTTRDPIRIIFHVIITRCIREQSRPRISLDSQ